MSEDVIADGVRLLARYRTLTRGYDPDMPTDMEKHRAKVLATLVSEERAAAALENERVWCEVILLAEDPRIIEKITRWVVEKRVAPKGAEGR